MCKRMVLEGTCVFGERSAKNHKRKICTQSGDDIDMFEELTNLKAEVENLKYTFKLVMLTRDEVDSVKKSVDEIKEEIILLNGGNKELTEILKNIDDFRYQGCYSIEGLMLNVEHEQRKIASNFLCSKCDNDSSSEVPLKKHCNTKNIVRFDQAAKDFSDEVKDFGLEGIEDIFQLEVLEGREISACNICNKGFDTNDEVKNHIETDHNDILAQIRKNVEEAADRSSDESGGDARIARHDDDGNFIG